MIASQTAAVDVLIRSADGLELKGRHWSRESPRGVLVIGHGFGEHGGCYRHVAEALGPALDIDVVAPDLRGHGRSPGRRGVVDSYEDLVADLRAAFDWAGNARPGLPRFVLGHSNGGQLALRLGLENPDGLTGLILSDPSLVVATKVSRVKLAIGRFLLRHAPHVTLSASLPAEMMTRDPEMQADHRTDPLRHSRISAPLYFGMVDGGRAILERAGQLVVPSLFLLGESDPVISPSATRRFFEDQGSADKTLIAYPDMRHEPLNELGREQVFSDLSAWLDARLRPS